VTLVGQTLAHYRITDAIGTGGMGEVYRATDTTLGRDVAVKVLPPDVARVPRRLARFRREAHLLASLNHPNIGAIYGLEEAGGVPFLVLELVEGEDLRQRLGRGAIPVEEALQIAHQIAEALEAAHAKGIVHRDLKPGNVKLTPDGRVKVLDFGLAKARVEESADGATSDSDLSHSPTIPQTDTVAGVILGTAPYMAPEQVRGRAVDKRADVWSFGVLLWEMLTGRALFAGDTLADVIAAVVTKQPDLDALPAATPSAVRQLVGRCLRRDLRARLPGIGAARLELQDLLSGATAEDVSSADVEVRGREGRRRRRERWAWGLALLGGGLAALMAAVLRERPPQTWAPAQLSIDLPDGLTLTDLLPLALSPDGRQVAFTGTAAGESGLFVRSLDSAAARRVPGTEGAYGPFWSPDGTSIAFFASQFVRKVSLGSGTVQTICPLPAPDTAVGGRGTRREPSSSRPEAPGPGSSRWRRPGARRSP
jgi:tRNA A-37 threonylcarbamoyl transferase component Bud32